MEKWLAYLRALPPGVQSGLLLGGAVLLVLLMGFPQRGAQAALAPEQDMPGAAEAVAPSADAPLPAAEKYRSDNRPTLVLDAGHGGADPGAVSADGTVLEWEVNQSMVDKVCALLAAHAGELRVVQALAPGAGGTTMARANTAVREEADLMLSLHLNADTSPHTRGFQCFPTPPGRLHHAGSYYFGQLLVEQVKQTEIPILGENGIFYSYFVWQGSKGYAKEIVDSIWADPAAPRADESFGVVEFSGCPAVLIEQWHISSPEDMALFYSDEGFDQMAGCIYRAVCAYFALTPAAGT